MQQSTHLTPTQQPPTLQQQLAQLVLNHGMAAVLEALSEECGDEQCRADEQGLVEYAQELEYASGDLERMARDMDDATERDMEVAL
jgi:hypothetical protein